MYEGNQATAHHMQSTTPKVKSAGISLMLGGGLNEYLVQSIQNLRLGRKFTFQQENEP